MSSISKCLDRGEWGRVKGDPEDCFVDGAREMGMALIGELETILAGYLKCKTLDEISHDDALSMVDQVGELFCELHQQVYGRSPNG